MRLLPFSLSLVLASKLFAHDLAPSKHAEMGPSMSWFISPILLSSTTTPASPSSFTGKDFMTSVFKTTARVQVSSNDKYLLVGSDGFPDHPMMIGITNWQQQVPLPQAYTGTNLWMIPLNPVKADKPTLIKGRFLRGAIALAANGIAIFNPQNNRGEVSQDIGELDKWGGHCGRADDYHYHIIPLHLQSVVGKGNPVAYALDGYPVYGATEPDGSTLKKLDECGGHEDAKYGYHYHGLAKSPYTFTGFHGTVTEVSGQVDPQPRASSPRPATGPLRGATITDWAIEGENKYKLGYTVNGEKRSISYVLSSTNLKMDFDNGKEGKTTETYDLNAKRGGGGDKPGESGKPRKKGQGQ